MQIKKHDRSHMVELRDGSAWRIWPGDISKTLRSARADPLLNFQVLLVKTAKAQFLISRRSEGASIPIAPQRSWGASTCNPYPTTFR
jgi:hypothetical protein